MVEILQCVKHGRRRVVAVAGIVIKCRACGYSTKDGLALACHALVFANDMDDQPGGKKTVQGFRRVGHVGAALPHRHDLLDEAAVQFLVMCNVARINAGLDHDALFLDKVESRIVGQLLAECL